MRRDLVLVANDPVVRATAITETPDVVALDIPDADTEAEALRKLARDATRAAPLLATNPSRARAMVDTAIRRVQDARAEEVAEGETEAR